MTDPETLLRALFDAAIASAQPAQCLPPFLPPWPERGRLVVLGAGKASAEMARVVEAHYGRPLEGLVVTRYGHAVPCQGIEVVEAAHPVPDVAGEEAARRMLDLAHNLSADDTVLCLISGGGSALLPLPAPGLDLAQKQEINRALLKSGATIGEMNTVRRHLSAIKGGRLAAACAPARVITLMISDVPGDAPCIIASGPTVGDATTCADALEVLARYAIPLPEGLQTALAAGALESIKPDDPRLARNAAHLIATPQAALEAAAQVARAAGFQAHILGDALEGEARDVAKVIAAITGQVLRHGQPFQRPCVLLSGGETTVTVRGSGSGGRNVEFLLALALALEGMPDVYALAGDTDGVDGAAEVAGALISPETLAQARALGLSPRAILEANDAHPFFAALGAQVITGPTLTNVNDFRAVLIS
ncbi:glycerate 2-kinase [Rhodobacter sp. JA431]|uniref:glycerate kinase type-2 family protein n=1 Tax=Rhodobacter sp. JA431 TaxID=570013 RepID=UPI000BD0F354|nr:glycerate kinase [Rhodobacter sp. JA431]SOB92182.1 glycerate 2-kinase [Rhodobacter sp. JA431]